jgi:hypothetical protein
LPSEPPGPPVDGGPFAIAQTLLCNYRVGDPGMVRAYYDGDAPLEGRDMCSSCGLGGFGRSAAAASAP